MAKNQQGKRLAPGSLWERFDTDGDGTITDEEISRGKEMLELELREEKSDAQRKMAWVAIISMCVFAVLPLMPFIPEARLSTLASLSDMLFLSQASVVGMFFGATAYMSKK
ncbi:MAG: hypothetical protein EB168_02610 [Euryarchaeota archaeon]|jgi:hypothetical protein|nr:hypothetical protein [Euryarchaeota archaeon]